MDTYNLSPVQSITDSRSNVYYGFNVTGIHGRPVASDVALIRNGHARAGRWRHPLLARTFIDFVEVPSS